MKLQILIFLFMTILFSIVLVLMVRKINDNSEKTLELSATKQEPKFSDGTEQNGVPLIYEDSDEEVANLLIEDDPQFWNSDIYNCPYGRWPGRICPWRRWPGRRWPRRRWPRRRWPMRPPRPQQPRFQPPRSQAPRVQPPRSQAPRPQAPRVQPPRSQAPRPQAPRVQPPRSQAPRVPRGRR